MSDFSPQTPDHYPLVYLKDTDSSLPDHVVTRDMRYTDFKIVAKGGKCLIQSCRDNHLNRTVAHKSLHKSIQNDKYEQKRFLREARVTANLQHPNTIPIYDLNRDNQNHYYFTMKLVEGLTLKEIIDKLKEKNAEIQTKYTLLQLIEIFLQVCYTLEYSHTHGVVHRDIKPSNILVGYFGEVVLLDWGLAKVWDSPKDDFGIMTFYDQNQNPSMTARGTLQATPLYMSPEQTTNAANLDHRTDIYSLGAVLYELLTLENLAWGESLNEILFHTRQDTPKTPREKTPERNIPEELEKICLKCIEKNPDNRYANMKDLIFAIITYREGNHPLNK